MRWTEELTNNYILKNEIHVYHYSWQKIEKFEEKLTCFFSYFMGISKNMYGHKEFCYKFTVPAGTEIFEYGNEVRFIISKNMKYIEV